jgi:predicted nucleic acid-binding protein
MPREYNIVIADTSCFILLHKINEIDILKKVFSSVVTTPEIAEEFGKTLPEWIEIKSPLNKKYQEILAIEVDYGEASAIALAIENLNSLTILDDQRARKFADKLNLNYTGTLAIFIKAKELGIISNVKFVLEKIQKTNFRLSHKVLGDILRLAGE